MNRHEAAAALAALGATLDRRLVSHIRLLEWSEERDQTDLGLERARALVRLGDWSKIPLLISGLRDGRVYTRALCLDALREATHETHGFDPRSDAGPRKKAIERWESWWNDRARDEFLHG
jgi:HEAT repeat protein